MAWNWKKQHFGELIVLHVAFLLISWFGIDVSRRYLQVFEGINLELSWAGKLMFNWPAILYILVFVNFLSFAVLIGHYAKYRSVSKISVIFFRMLLVVNIAYIGLFFGGIFYGVSQD